MEDHPLVTHVPTAPLYPNPVTTERIYWDHAATTPMAPTVWEAMAPFVLDQFGNPASLHWFGRQANKAVQQAQATLRQLLGLTTQDTLLLTSGGTEADNLAILGVMRHLRRPPPHKTHLIVSAFEHPAVLEPARHLAEHEGFRLSVLPVTAEGFVTPDALAPLLTPDTALVSVMHANNEVGSIQPIAQLAELAHQAGALFHTDAVQTVGKLPFQMPDLGVDYLSLSGHKLYGPKGAGLLAIKDGAPLPEPLLWGGGQQDALRPGTVNAAAWVGLAAALQHCTHQLPTEVPRLRQLQQDLMAHIEAALPTTAHLNGPRDLDRRLPGHVNYSFTRRNPATDEEQPVEGESLVLKLDLKKIAVSSGSACHAAKLAPSDVLMAMGVPLVRAQSSLRFTLGHSSHGDQIPQVVAALTSLLTPSP